VKNVIVKLIHLELKLENINNNTMGLYESSNGDFKNTEDMDTAYIYNALQKAKANRHQGNIAVLEAELAKREAENSSK